MTNELKFIECDTCKAKPGTPILCDGCLHNRSVIEKLRHEHQVPWEEKLLLMDFMTKKLNGDEVSRIILFIRSHHAHLKERVMKAFELGGKIVDYEGELRPGWRDKFNKLLE